MTNINIEELQRSNNTHAQIYRNLLNHEMDEEEKNELRIGLRKAIVKGRLKNAVIILHRQSESICSCYDHVKLQNITTAKEITAIGSVAKQWLAVKKMVMDPRILRVRHIHVMEGYSEIIANYVRLLDNMVDIMKDQISCRRQMMTTHIHLTSDEELEQMRFFDRAVDNLNTEYHW